MRRGVAHHLPHDLPRPPEHGMMECVVDNEHPPPNPPGSPGRLGGPAPADEPYSPTEPKSAEPTPAEPVSAEPLSADGEPTPPAGAPAQPAPGSELSVRPPDQATPATPPPPPIDPEAVRQFQEFQQFQQFQELMRQQQEQGFPQGTPPPPGTLQPWGPPPQRSEPVWKRALRPVAGKVITAAIVALLLAGAGYWLLEKLPGSGPPESPGPPHVIGGKKAETNLIYETDPRNAVQKIYDDIAQGDPESACGRFTDEARAEFADHLGRYGGSCEDIVATIHASVVAARMKDEYANPDKLTGVTAQPTDEPVTVSSCTLGVTGGPPLGLLTVSKIERSEGGQYIVTGHEAEPETCAGVPSAPPTT
ncbi:hypothetical protein [Actinophytocola sp.]|uniref:hypothetical protein n=1 Tax=Actinophytocola sp. TaxID=1872138 RepID=UPI003D6BED8E